MGCAPSKGNNFGTLNSLRRTRMLLAAPPENTRQSAFEEGDHCNSTFTKDMETREWKSSGHTPVLQRGILQKKKPDSERVNMENLADNKRKERNADKQDVTEKKDGRKPKKTTRGSKGLKKKEKEKLSSDHKVDFPDPLVKAHQAAYAFLNPNITKYDILLGLLEQATQTQGSVQPMVTFMALRYEEIIQGLEEIADEGEKLLKENGEHLAWTSQMRNLSSTPPLKSANSEPPPDLLQQLLQYTTQRMRNVSQTVGGIGDSALEEAVEYFASVSELLEEKLKVKQVVEARLMHLLTRIEMASLRRPGPEDSALFSEDSGIGAESESLAGSDRRFRRESCESSGTNRMTPVSPMECSSVQIAQRVSRQKLLSQISPSVSLTSLNSLGSTCTLLGNDQRDSLLGSFDDEDEDDNDRDVGGCHVRFRARSNSSPVDCEQSHRLPSKRIENPQNVEMTLKMKNAISGKIQFVPSKNSGAKSKVADSPKTSRRQWTDEEERTPRRPQTAVPAPKAGVKKATVARQQRSRSAESLRSKGEDPTLLELERTQKDLNQRLQRLSKSKTGVNTRTALPKQNRGSSPAQSPVIQHKQPSTEKHIAPPSPKAKVESTKRNATKQDVTFKGPIRATPPPSPPSSPRPSSSLRRGRNSVKKLIDTFSQGIEDLDDPKVQGPLKGVRRCGVPVLPGLGNVEALLSAGATSCRPESERTEYLDLDSLPPPPMEVLMDNSFEGAQNLSGDDGCTKIGKSPLLKRSAVSQRLRASVQSVLPSRGGLPQASKIIPLARADRQDSQDIRPKEVHLEAEPGKGNHQARKIIHLRLSSDSQTERSSTSYVGNNTSCTQEGSAVSLEDGSVPGHSSISGQPPATPTKSRNRILPSTPSTPSNAYQRFPSPLNLRRQPTPPSSSTPPLNRKLPTTPTSQGRFPSPTGAKQNISNSIASYPFKAPSPPASPKLQRWSRENSSEDLSSARKTNNARSVFCPVSSSLFEASTPEPPQAWISTGVSFVTRPQGSRGRFPVSTQGPRPFIRRSHSDRRPSLTLPPQSQGVSVAESCGSEPSICSQRLDDEPISDGSDLWGSQSDLRAGLRSTSHPNLCVVGQAFHRD